MINMEVLGLRLRYFRLKRNLSVEQVRVYLQLESVQAIYKWENGKCLPQADRLLLLMQLYEIEVEDLLLPTENKLPASINTYRTNARPRLKAYFYFLKGLQ